MSNGFGTQLWGTKVWVPDVTHVKNLSEDERSNKNSKRVKIFFETFRLFFSGCKNLRGLEPGRGPQLGDPNFPGHGPGPMPTLA